MTTTFENARVGDRVWDFIYGWGKIEHIESKSQYPLKIRFASGSGYAFTLKGENLMGIPQTLFWDEIKYEIPTQPLRMKLIHGVEVPDISFRPSHGEDYYAVDLMEETFYYDYYTWRGDVTDLILYERGLCYPLTEGGKKAAILHAKAMLGIKE